LTVRGAFFVAPPSFPYIESGFTVVPLGRHKGVWFVTLTCPNCGNDRNFQVKTLQMHVVHLEDGRVEISEESRPAILEVLCDECESALKFEEFEDALRKEVLLTIGAR
jgi:RNase P subunit RPR2